MYEYEKAVQFMNDCGMDKKLLLGMVYGLYQDYLIDSDQLDYLYELVDPEEQYNDTSEYWWDLDLHKEEFFSCIDKLPEWTDDMEWHYDGEEIMSFDVDAVNCLYDLFSTIRNGIAQCGKYEEDDHTGYSGMAYIHFN